MKNRIHIIKAAAFIALIAGWVSIPYVTSKVGAFGGGGGVPIVVRTANLASPTGSTDPHGEAEWQLYANGNREIEVEIEDVHNLPVGTMVAAFVDGSSIGQFALEIDERGRLKLRTEDGQQVPNTNDGSTVEVRNGSTILVAGVFGGGGPNPTPTVSPTASPTGTPNGTPSPSPTVTASPSPTGSPSPSPSPTGTPNAGDRFAGLSGPTLNGVVPRGFSQFEVHSSRLELDTRISQVNLPGGTSLSVSVDNVAVGNLILESDGEGQQRLRTDRGQTVPNVNVGSTIVIKNGGTTILSGIYAGATGPTPSPSPTASPSPTQGRSFETHMLGSGITPPVTTNGNGEIKVTLNAAETQATMFGEFHNLSSNQTGARIETTVGSVTTIRDLGVVGGINGDFAMVTFDVTPTQVQQLRAGLWSGVITSVNNPAGEIRGNFRQRGGESDLNGDGSNDFAIFRPSTSDWWTFNTDGVQVQTFGSATDKVVSGDYDGDGRTDMAVYKSIGGQGVWSIRRSSDQGLTEVYWGLNTDKAVRGDFDGDGRLDFAVYRPSQGVWYVQKSNNTGNMIVQYGLAEDQPVPLDIDGDGKDDIVQFRPSNGVWYWIRSSDGQTGAAQFGLSGDIPTPGDYDGDGKGDLAVFRPSTGVWYLHRSSDFSYAGVQWGVSTDIPVPGNYDQDGKTDIAVFRPSEGNWYIFRSSDLGFSVLNFGSSGDIPLGAR